MNVVFILSDQLRADCVGCYGNTIIRTPHIDALASRGTRFDRAFAQHPQCAPSRASFLTGRYPHENGAISNHTAMAEAEATVGERFIDAGWRSIGLGKLHLFDVKERASFTDTMLCGGQQSDATSPDALRDDYKHWLKAHGYWEAAQRAYAHHASDEYWANFQATVNPIPAEAFFDNWVGDRAVEYIESMERDQPFFMFVGLPNPHMPFDCPEPYASMYDPADMPIPRSFHEGDLSTKPPMHAAFRRSGRKVNYEHMTEDHLRRAMAYYYGSITLVDDQVGKIVHALESAGQLEQTLIVFCSDHGELLGDFGMLTKSIDQYPMLYDCGLRVPLVIREPGGVEGMTSQAMVELIDLAPTMLASAGLEPLPEMQGCDLRPLLQGGAGPDRQTVFAESGAVKMVRGDQYKLVYYPGQPYGELYDIQQDPDELHNLYDDERHAAIRQSMIQALLDRLIATEGPLHGESPKGPAYWRTQYQLPFQLDEPTS